jgi:hypothetical protein
VLGLGEGEGESVEDLGGAEPDVVVAARGDPGAEGRRVPGAQSAVHPVGRDDEVRAGRRFGDRALELQPDAEGSGPFGEQVEQPGAADAEALVTVVTGRQVAYVGDAVAPADGRLLDRPRRGRVVLLELVEEAAPVRHAPAVGRALGVALVDGDVMGRVPPLEQDGEVQARGPASDADDLHVHP